jgi:hypothetical protein
MPRGNMAKIYRYAGPQIIATRVAGQTAGCSVDSPQDVRRWVRQSGQILERAGQVTATFVIDEAGTLRIADRRSEHVACAGGKPVLSAGEITFSITPAQVSVEWVTNQSTGYCPEPESWSTVAAGLTRASIQAPPRFSQEFVFRRCVRCGSLNVVRDNFFECGTCSAELPSEWNVVPAAIPLKNR